MARTSCIQHLPEMPVSILLLDYLIICDGNACAAKVLRQMEHWHNVRLHQIEQSQITNTQLVETGRPATQDTTMWVFKSIQQMQIELMGEHGEKAVGAAFQQLVSSGYLKARKNPIKPIDRTLQYQFCVLAVQDALDSIDRSAVKRLLAKPQNCGFQTAELRNARGQNCGMHAAEMRDSIDNDSETTFKEESCVTREPDETNRPDERGESFEFTTFIQQYGPHHPEKRYAANTEWIRLRPNGQTVRDIMRGLKAHQAGDKWLKGFIVTPDKFLREKQWMFDPRPSLDELRKKHPTEWEDALVKARDLVSQGPAGKWARDDSPAFEQAVKDHAEEIFRERVRTAEVAKPARRESATDRAMANWGSAE